MEQRLGIIADDFTGANDTGIQLTKKGISTTVLVDLPDQQVDADGQVIIVDTDSRAKPEQEAFEAVSKAASFLLKNKTTHFYKKVDSTLRGQIGSEIAALDRMLNPDIVVFAPAFPKLGRTTVNGVHYVDGEPVSETEFGKDPKTPVKDSQISELLKGYADGKLTQFAVGDSIDSVQHKLDQGQSWFICDAEKEEDLEAIGETFSKLGQTILWVGSAGLIEYIPFGLDNHNQEDPVTFYSSDSSKVLTVSGSLSQKTKGQLMELSNLDDVQTLEIDPIDLLEGSALNNFNINELEKDKDFMLYVDSNQENLNKTNEFKETNSLTNEQIGNAISKGLAELAETIIENFSINHMILTGGDTAKAVCAELNISVLKLMKEIETGIPLGKANLNGNTQWIVTKAGGFGTDQSLIHVRNYLKGMKHQDDE